MGGQPGPGQDNVHSLSVLMPAYNEAENIESAVQEICREVLNKVPGAFLIVVDDGSTDSTGTILDQLAEKDKRIRAIHTANSGHGPAIATALNEADSTFVFLVDSDMQIPLDCFDKFWQLAKEPGADGIFGIRQHRQDPLLRLVLSKFISATLSAMFNVTLIDGNAPCKLFRRQVWTQLYNRINELKPLAPSLMIAIYAERQNLKIIKIPVSHRARQRGVGSLRLNKLICFCWVAFKQLMQLRNKIL